jgi:hypothetical protein
MMVVISYLYTSCTNGTREVHPKIAKFHRLMILGFFYYARSVARKFSKSILFYSTVFSIKASHFPPINRSNGKFHSKIKRGFKIFKISHQSNL